MNLLWMLLFLPNLSSAELTIPPPSGNVVHCSFDKNPNHPGTNMEFWDEPYHGDDMYCVVEE